MYAICRSGLCSYRLISSLLCLVCLGCLSCLGCDPYEETKLKIMSPSAGQQLLPAAPVTVVVRGPADEMGAVMVNGQSALGERSDGGRQLGQLISPVDGLGFVTAELPGDPYLVVRSWQQGTFILPDSWYPDTLKLRLGPEALNGGAGSVAEIIKRCLIGAELSGFVEPIQVDLGITEAVIYIDSAVIRDAELRLSVMDGALTLEVTLKPLELSYRIESELLSTSGLGLYEALRLRSSTSLAVSGVELINPEVSGADLRAMDNNIPGYLLNPIIDALRDRFVETMSEAISEVTREVTAQLFAQLRPQLSVALERPITQAIELTTVGVAGEGLELSFMSQLRAATPLLAAPGQGALFRFPPQEPDAAEAAALYVGSPLVNQLAFAAWDAGNFDGLSYSRARLEQLGLEQLSFPYTQFERADVQLLLPPLLEWDAGGPYLELGGLRADLTIDLSRDTTLWTAARVPLRLALVEGALRVERDESRELQTREIMLNRLNALAERSEALKLVRAALPGVVYDVFGELPVISVPPLRVQALTSGPVVTISPKLLAARPLANAWRLELRLGLE